MRTSVSAEAFGAHNKKEDFVPPVIEKSQEIKDQIIERLHSCFMFSGISTEEISIVADAMSVVKVTKGEIVIEEGKDGDDMFVIEDRLDDWDA